MHDKHYTMLTHNLSDNWDISRKTIMAKTREMHEVALRRSEAIEVISTAVARLVKTEQHLLRHGLDSLEPGVSRLDIIEDPGSIDEIAGSFLSSQIHMDMQLRRLGRSTVYKICRYLHDVSFPLEKSYVAIRNWNEKETEKYDEWRSINPDSLETTFKLMEAHHCLRSLLRDQLKLLTSLKHEFSNAIDADEVNGKLMELLVHCVEAGLAVQDLMIRKQLNKNDATMEAGENALMRAIHPTVNAHRSANVSLVECVAGTAALKICETLITFRMDMQREKDKIEKAIGVNQSI